MPCRQSFDTLVPTVLVRLDRNPFHHGTLGADRSLGRAGIQVHAVVESPTSPVALSRHLRSVRARPGTDSSAELAALLTRIAGETTDDPSHPVLPVSLDDVSALTPARRRDRLSPRLLLPEQTEEQQLRDAGKAALAGPARSWACPTCPTRRGAYGLDAYAARRGVRAAHGVPLPVDFFASYGDWFTRQAVPALDERLIASVAPAGDGFELLTEDGEPDPRPAGGARGRRPALH